MINEVAPC